ncbi:MAG: hypothetical protein KTR22_05005 [Flavobacteriaceae bacterium]|nr:hypothetical protein [Flavobacteriaceae bacterium]
MKKWKHRLFTRLKDDSEYPLLAGVVTGLYPFISYYTHNFQLVNSWQHFLFFFALFIVAPALLFWVLYRISKKGFLKKWRTYGLFFLTVFVFLLFVEIALYAQLKKKLALITFLAVIPFAFLLYKHYKKIIFLQVIIAIIGLFYLIPVLWEQRSISTEWIKQPDAIEAIVLKKKPNIYLIQPDGYVNFEEIVRGHYNMDNSQFKSFLDDNGFTLYPNFRSNYPSTLASNGALFGMKHHYFNYGTHPSKSLNARKLLVSDNPALNILKDNGYKTHLILESPYVLLNRPKMGYDACNFSTFDVPFIGSGFRNKKDVQTDLEGYLVMDTSEPKFFFVEFFNPGHIKNRKGDAQGVEGEKKHWEESLAYANERLTKMITTIEKKDPGAMIILLADHGGYVGLEYAMQMYEKTTQRDHIYSLFASLCAIKWPETNLNGVDVDLKSSVNLFRTIFAYLGEDPSLLQHRQPDDSYIILMKNAPKGVYRYINGKGEIVCEQMLPMHTP